MVWWWCYGTTVEDGVVGVILLIVPLILLMVVWWLCEGFIVALQPMHSSERYIEALNRHHSPKLGLKIVSRSR